MMKAAPFTLVDRDSKGRIIRTERVRWIPLRNIRPLNNAMLKRSA
jgi:hypothetical protein